MEIEQSLEEGECSDTQDSQTTRDSQTTLDSQDTRNRRETRDSLETQAPTFLDSQDTLNDTQDSKRLLIDTQEVKFKRYYFYKIRNSFK